MLLTNLPELLPIVTSNYQWICLFLVLGSFLQSFKSIFLAFGEGALAQYLFFCGFFIVGHPLSIYLCFSLGYPVHVITVGFTVGAIVTSFLYYLRVNCFAIEWEELSREARKSKVDSGRHQKSGVDNKDLKIGLLQ